MREVEVRLFDRAHPSAGLVEDVFYCEEDVELGDELPAICQEEYGADFSVSTVMVPWYKNPQDWRSPKLHAETPKDGE